MSTSLYRLPTLLATFGLATALTWSQPAGAQQAHDAYQHAVLLSQSYRIQPNLTYGTASGKEQKLDLYLPTRATGPLPLVVLIHGGGWVAGEKEGMAMEALPYLQLGYAVANVEYRLAKDALAPAAVEDTVCALQWLGQNAQRFKLDVSKVIVTGGSAGGHLALMTGMVPQDTPFLNQCAWNGSTWAGPYTSGLPKVAAVINWFGITDVADMVEGPNIRSYAVGWFGQLGGRMELARTLSPIRYARRDGPAVLTIHGDADTVVPTAHGLKLKQVLDAAGQPNRLLTVPGGGHGGFTAEQQLTAWNAIRDFLRERNLLPATAAR
jgi:acetyl esterase/lipase